MDKRILAIIAVILLLLLLWWYLSPSITITEAGWVNMGSPTDSKKLHEEEVRASIVRWDDCCEGDIKVEFEYSWEFYDDDWTPTDDCCHDPVEWVVKDSIGREVFSSESCSPVDTFGDPYEILDGTWDCTHHWTVTVVNGCLYPINYEWELTLWCYE